MRRFLLAALCVLLPAFAQARNAGQQATIANGGSAPTWSLDLRAGNYAPLVETRANSVWDYISDGTIGTAGANTPLVRVFSQTTPTQARGVGIWAGRSNVWQDNTQTQSRTVSNGTAYSVWCTSVSGTATITLSNAFAAVATCNGWPGAVSGTATTTTLTGTVAGTVVHANMNAMTTTVIAGPPIVTTTATVSTSAVHLTIPTSVITGFRDDAGTIVAEFIPVSLSVVSGSVFAFGDGVGVTNQIRARIPTGGATIEALYTGASTSATAIGTTPNLQAGLPNRVAVAWGGGRICIAANGGAPGCITPSVPIAAGALTTLVLGGASNFGGPLEGYLQKVNYRPQNLPHQLSRLSSQ